MKCSSSYMIVFPVHLSLVILLPHLHCTTPPLVLVGIENMFGLDPVIGSSLALYSNDVTKKTTPKMAHINSPSSLHHRSPASEPQHGITAVGAHKPRGRRALVTPGAQEQWQLCNAPGPNLIGACCHPTHALLWIRLNRSWRSWHRSSSSTGRYSITTTTSSSTSTVATTHLF